MVDNFTRTSPKNGLAIIKVDNIDAGTCQQEVF